VYIVSFRGRVRVGEGMVIGVYCQFQGEGEGRVIGVYCQFQGEGEGRVIGVYCQFQEYFSYIVTN
jgi:hypothetical protein